MKKRKKMRYIVAVETTGSIPFMYSFIDKKEAEIYANKRKKENPEAVIFMGVIKWHLMK